MIHLKKKIFQARIFFWMETAPIMIGIKNCKWLFKSHVKIPNHKEARLGHLRKRLKSLKHSHKRNRRNKTSKEEVWNMVRMPATFLSKSPKKNEPPQYHQIKRSHPRCQWSIFHLWIHRKRFVQIDDITQRKRIKIIRWRDSLHHQAAQWSITVHP